MKSIDYRPPEFRSMDPSVRAKAWIFEKEGGHLFSETKRIATFHSAYTALVMGALVGTRILLSDALLYEPSAWP